MRKIVFIGSVILFVSLLSSCLKGGGKGVIAVNTDEDSTLVFEMDSSLMYEDVYERDVASSMLYLTPFSECSLAGSAAYGKDFNIDVAVLSSDSAYIIMSELFDKDEKGNPLWRLTDSVKIYFPAGASIGWPGYVVREDVIDYDLMAVMPDDNDWIDTEVYNNLLGVWRLNAEEKTITPISTNNVSCINESYGVY
ncbi:MAG: hypothetical protein J6L02_07440 [Bacteroidales bacterium]|nr:hypothetical protein [Bacteroidales bacterium]